MTQKRFLIPSLFAAGFGSLDPVQVGAVPSDEPGTKDEGFAKATMLRLFTQDHLVSLAQHRSHSSHSSHRSGGGGGGHYSHTSHRSSYGGGYSPAPVYSPPPAPAPLYRSPPPSPAPYEAPATPSSGADNGSSPPSLSGRTQRFNSIVRRVQIALLAQGYYRGAIDGVVGPGLRGALRQFQSSRGLEATGTITPQTLNALRVASE